ncbi:MAG: hypothetical protein KDK45_02055 [Leptospiraceae bacterium]|nr:hypothetical protein [Leptospiraceae bacterium]
MQELDYKHDIKRQAKHITGKTRRKVRVKKALDGISKLELHDATKDLLSEIIKTFHGFIPDKYISPLLPDIRRDKAIKLLHGNHIRVIPTHLIRAGFINKKTRIGKLELERIYG